MGFYFELLLVIAVFASGFIALIDRMFFYKARYARVSTIPGFETLSKHDKRELTKGPLFADYAHSLFPVLLFVFCLRGFVVELFEVPSGSMLPTIQLGDYFLVNKFIYGVRIPLFNTELFKVSKPQAGDIMVFQDPVNPQIDLIKTVIGLPGDHITYINKKLTINGVPVPRKYIGRTIELNNANLGYTAVDHYQETINGHVHDIYNTPGIAPVDFTNLVVPAGEYFMMGDNRDNSDDSRGWGFAPYKNIEGKAYMLVFSWNSVTHRVRWDRIGKKMP
ncbi:MAG: signal peptidase I [Gammaproteobacteria bacterium]|nr:signal peptidase I [Gammaproteobacteria bacterium]